MPTSTLGENWFIMGAAVSCWRGKEASLSVCKVSRKAAQRLYRRYEEVSWVRVSNKRLRDKHLHNKWTNLPQTIFPCCAFCDLHTWNKLGMCAVNVEKYFILFKPELAELNSRKELFSTCRHKASLLLIPKENPLDGGWKRKFDKTGHIVKLKPIRYLIC